MPVRILKFLFGRTALREGSMAHAEGFFRDRVKALSRDIVPDMPDLAVRAILQEAMRRAGEKEKDGVPRAAPFLSEVDLAAAQVVRITEGDISSDPRIRSILQFHQTT